MAKDELGSAMDWKIAGSWGWCTWSLRITAAYSSIQRATRFLLVEGMAVLRECRCRGAYPAKSASSSRLTRLHGSVMSTRLPLRR